MLQFYRIAASANFHTKPKAPWWARFGEIDRVRAVVTRLTIIRGNGRVIVPFSCIEISHKFTACA